MRGGMRLRCPFGLTSLALLMLLCLLLKTNQTHL
ncbi:hypothetical protein LINPERHAP1_LOCUS19421 [Linum perenne]